MNRKHKSRARWLAERWVRERASDLGARWDTLQQQLLPAGWPTRCERMHTLPDGDLSAWQPAEGSSSAELLILLRKLPLGERRWLGALLDASTVGAATLVEAVERLQLDWWARLDPLHAHRQYAEQLAALAEQLGLERAATAAYLENEPKLAREVDRLLFESLPMRLRMDMSNEAQPGTGFYLRWWYQQLTDRSDASKPTALGQNDWPEMPASWLALGWICALRHSNGEKMAPGK